MAQKYFRSVSSSRTRKRTEAGIAIDAARVGAEDALESAMNLSLQVLVQNSVDERDS
ncbi:hypothetical protein ABH922_005250 [Rhodococcus sp. 27YEA15]